MSDQHPQNNSTLLTYPMALEYLEEKTHWHQGSNLSSLMPETSSFSKCKYHQKQALITCIYASKQKSEMMLISDHNLVRYSKIVHI
jgi:hypothetical protein